MECSEENIGESGRTFGDRLKEHLKSPIPYSLKQPVHRTSCEFEVFYCSGQGVTWCHWDQKGSTVYPCKQPIPQQEPEEITATPHMR